MIQQPFDRRRKAGSVRDSNEGIRRHELSGDGFEVLHVRPDHNGHARKCRFQNVVPATRGDRAADKHHIGQVVDLANSPSVSSSRIPGSFR